MRVACKVVFDGVPYGDDRLTDLVRQAAADIGKAEADLMYIVPSTDDMDAIHAAAGLHASRTHPDYVYATTQGPRKAEEPAPPEGDGWEPNMDYHDGWERFDYHEEAYWRKRISDDRPS